MKRSVVILIALAFFSCEKEENGSLHFPPELMETPMGFDPILFPEGNEYSPARWALGKRLFFDPIMSVDSTISCSSCHDPQRAFSDNMAMSLGVEQRIGSRNAPTLTNVAYHPYFTFEGGVPTLEMQVFVPIQEHNEFDFNIVLLADRLSTDSVYINMALKAYGRNPDAFVITRSLANFQRSLISGYSAYDQYAHYQDESAMTDSEIRGMELFFSNKTNCSSCHSGFNFTNYTFENNGLYSEYEDEGRFRLTGDDNDLHKFKVPTLRNVGVTSPYMHDGSFKTLREVVNHYNQGGQENDRKSDLIQALNLTEGEQEDLVHFLESLTDNSFINNPIFK